MPNSGFVSGDAGTAVRDGFAFWPGPHPARSFSGRAPVLWGLKIFDVDRSRDYTGLGQRPYTNSAFCSFFLLKCSQWPGPRPMRILVWEKCFYFHIKEYILPMENLET